jgi:putative colanic acid biosynthesis acetyltransferase WcaF
VELSRYDQSWFDRGRPAVVVMLWHTISRTIYRLPVHNAHGFRAFLLRLFGAKVGRGVMLRPTSEITYPWKVEIGDDTWIDDEVVLYSLGEITIGSNCVLSRRTFVSTGNHRADDPAFGLVIKPCVIEDGVWLQADCFVAQDVTIGHNTVVRARSSVFRSLPPDTICQGTPAVVVSPRRLSS